MLPYVWKQEKSIIPIQTTSDTPNLRKCSRVVEENRMRYVISDIHGCMREYDALLNKISFSEDDQLYILGDVVDRGLDSIDVLRDMMKRKNVSFILGNHDFLFCYFIKNLGYDLCGFKSEEDKEDFRSWIKDGGIFTLKGFIDLPDKEKKAIYEYIMNASVYETVECGENKYILVHAGISEFEAGKALEEYRFTDFICERMDYSRRYYLDRNTYIISGHTPTSLIRADKKPEVFVGNGHIAIDCGYVYGGRLAAYCIDTGEITYVERDDGVNETTSDTIQMDERLS